MRGGPRSKGVWLSYTDGSRPGAPLTLLPLEWAPHIWDRATPTGSRRDKELAVAELATTMFDMEELAPRKREPLRRRDRKRITRMVSKAATCVASLRLWPRGLRYAGASAPPWNGSKIPTVHPLTGFASVRGLSRGDGCGASRRERAGGRPRRPSPSSDRHSVNLWPDPHAGRLPCFQHADAELSPRGIS